MALRSDVLERTVVRFAPDLLVADFLPAGPHGELLPALDELERQGGVAIAGFRDVIDDPAFVRDLWARSGVYEVLRSRYAGICVYGDPGMVDFVHDYGLDADLAARVRYCGYLGRRSPVTTDAPIYERPIVLASGGGGVDAGRFLESFVGAANRLRPARGGTWLMITGPLMRPPEHAHLVRLGEAAGVTVRRLVPDLRAHTALADCVVGMAGYNTCCDLLTFRRPSVLVPRGGPSREQQIRAERLAAWGLTSVVQPEELDAARLAREIGAQLDTPPPPTPPVSLAGLEDAVEAFDLATAGARAVV
jgi:predicted glycosyltransferase